MAEIKIALAGNPNCGKTTMFNELTGASQYVGNWPGVTVEKKEGKLKGHKEVIIEDLPGIYSLSPYTLEEVVSRTYLINEKPDVILDLVDASNLERNLYLTTQLLEVGVPVVVALNMIDLVEKNGDKIDTKKLSKALGCPVVETSAVNGTGVMEAAEAAIAQTKKAAPQAKWFDEDNAAVLEAGSRRPGQVRPRPRAVVRRQAVRARQQGHRGPEPDPLRAGAAERLHQGAGAGL